MSFQNFLRSNAKWLSAGALLAFISSFGQTFFISVFSEEIRNSFDLSHGEWGGLYSIGTMASALIMIWAGSLADIFRVRNLGPLVFIGLGFACLTLATASHVAMLVIAIFLMRLFGQGLASHISQVSMARWYVATRGKALSIASLGISFGEAFLPLVFVGLLAVFEWRTLWIGCALFVFAMAPLLRVLLAKERTPKSVAKENKSIGMNGQHWTRLESLKHPLFWCVFPTIFGISAFITAFFFHHVHYADVKGWSHVNIVALFPVYSFSGITAMLIAGWAVDKYGAHRLFPIFQIPIAIAFIFFGFTETPTGAAIALMIMAITSGANSAVPSAFWAEVYGTEYLGSIRAAVTAVTVFGSAIGPLVTGYYIDNGVSLDTQFGWIALYFLLSSAAAAFGVSRIRSSLSFTT